MDSVHVHCHICLGCNGCSFYKQLGENKVAMCEVGGRLKMHSVHLTHPGSSAVQVWEGLGVVKTGRVMLGETNPANSLPGTIRGDFCIDVSK